MEQEEEFFTVREVAQYFKITEKAVRIQIGRKRLHANKIAGEWRISRRDRDAFEKLTHTGERSAEDLATVA